MSLTDKRVFDSQSLSSNSDAPTQEKSVQTVVKVSPFILDPYRGRASVTSDKKFVTVLSLEASQQSKQFYSLLRYCPFHDIQENHIRVIELPRKTKLQFVKQNRFSEEGLKKLALADDDGVADFCTDMLIRMHSGKNPTYREAETQTNIMVRPYLLEEPRVATIFISTGIQVTPAGCGNNSLRSSIDTV